MRHQIRNLKSRNFHHYCTPTLSLKNSWRTSQEKFRLAHPTAPSISKYATLLVNIKMDPVFLIVLLDLFTNLSAGWFGAAAIIPFGSKSPKSKWLIPLNIGFGIISLLAAYIIRKTVGL